jgi:predicted kinase
MNHLILLRGLPGSGKSTLAQVLAEDKYPVYSIDDYFTDNVSLQYHFEFDKNHLAYKQCQDNAKNAMLLGVKKIFIDNTFTLEWEIEPYFKLAAENNYLVHVVTVEKHHSNNNIHQISDEQIKKMAAKYKVQLF